MQKLTAVSDRFNMLYSLCIMLLQRVNVNIELRGLYFGKMVDCLPTVTLVLPFQSAQIIRQRGTIFTILTLRLCNYFSWDSIVIHFQGILRNETDVQNIH